MWLLMTHWVHSLFNEKFDAYARKKNAKISESKSLRVY